MPHHPHPRPPSLLKSALWDETRRAPLPKQTVPFFTSAIRAPRQREIPTLLNTQKQLSAWNLCFKRVVQGLSRVRLFATPRTAACQASLSLIIAQSLPKFVSIELVMLSNHLILCRPLLLLPSIFPSIRVFANELALHIRWPKYWSFSISPSNEYSMLASFRVDWFDLLAFQGTSGVFSSTTVWKHQFFGFISSALWPSSHICWLLRKGCK